MGGVIGVDWGGNYGAASNFTSTLNQGLGTAVTSTGDYTFDSISDAAYRLPFGTVYSPSVDSRYVPPAGKTGKLYTGLQTVIHSSDTPLTAAGIYRFSAGTALNQLQKTNPTNTVASTMSLSVAYLVKKADFLNGLSSAAGLSFSNAIGAASLDVMVRNTNAATIGFLVQEGTGWYATVSKPAVENSYSVLSVNPYTANWYAFDPTANQFLNTNLLGTATVGSTFTNIQAFGIYGQHMSVNGTASNAEKFDVQGFSGSFAVIPEPATIGMLGLGALATLLFRRLRLKE